VTGHLVTTAVPLQCHVISKRGWDTSYERRKQDHGSVNGLAEGQLSGKPGRSAESDGHPSA
jgi:hypothetical protein